MGNEPTVRFSGVSFSYAETPVLKDVSFEVPSGSVVAVAGPNGGGKTTILRLVLGLEKPNAGRVCVLGSSPEKARSRIGYMPQMLKVDPQLPMSVLDVVLMGRMSPGRIWTNRADRDAALSALESVELTFAAGRRFASLSGGERQRVLIARAIVSGPELLLFDEPTSMIDSASQGNFAAILTRIRGSATILVVTHDIGFVSGLVDRVLLVNRSVKSEAVSRVSGKSFEEVYGEKLHAISHNPPPAEVRL